MPITLDDAGLHIQNQAEIVAEMAEAMTTATNSDGVTLAFGPNWLTSPDSVDGQLLNTIGEQLASLHGCAQGLYGSIGVGAQGKTLDNVMTIAGLPRKPKEYSEVTATLTATGAGCTVPKNTVLKTAAGVQFGVSEAVTIAPSGTATVLCRALEAGPLAAAAGTLTIIGTPVAGLASCTNAADAVLGTYVETDPELRARHADSTAGAGVQILDAIRADVLQVPGVTGCRVYENDTDIFDANGVTPHSIWVVVEGGDTQAIVNAIGGAKGGGTRTFGATTGTFVDSQGFSHAIAFDRVTYIDWWIKATLTPAATADEQTAVKASLVAYVNGLGPGSAPTPFGMLVAVGEVVPQKTGCALQVSTVAPGAYNGIFPTPGKSQRVRTETAKVVVV